VLYNGNDIALINIAKKSRCVLKFPYAFENCRLYNNDAKLILRGEFGFIEYQRTK
jgi:hypothetical protein